MLTFSRLLLVSAVLLLSSSIDVEAGSKHHQISKFNSHTSTETKLAGLVERLVKLEERIEQRFIESSSSQDEQSIVSPSSSSSSSSVEIDSIEDVDNTSDASVRIAFLKYQQDFHKHYINGNEKEERFQIFKQNYHSLPLSVQTNYISKQNKGIEKGHIIGSIPNTPQFGLTVLSDFTPAEFQKMRGLNSTLFREVHSGLAVANPQEGLVSVAAFLPDSFDWRTHSGIVTPVKNQGQCGSCWSFSVVQSVESAWALAGNPLISLAPQQSLDCDTAQSGCNGGWPSTNIDYLVSNGVMSEDNYPYQATQGNCQYDSNKVSAVIEGKRSATQSLNEDEIAQNLMAYGPVSIGADASKWNQYTGGIMNRNSCSSDPASLDHAITLVGWNTDPKSKIKYWIVRNSWGQQWGDNGYLYLKYGENTCGLANSALVVTVARRNQNQ